AIPARLRLPPHHHHRHGPLVRQASRRHPHAGLSDITWGAPPPTVPPGPVGSWNRPDLPGVVGGGSQSPGKGSPMRQRRVLAMLVLALLLAAVPTAAQAKGASKATISGGGSGGLPGGPIELARGGAAGHSARP